MANRVPHASQRDMVRPRLRKGTFSCTECKFRKKRCVMMAPGDASCKSCTRFSRTCRRQGEGIALDCSVLDRINHVERLVQQYLERYHEGPAPSSDAESLTCSKSRPDLLSVKEAASRAPNLLPSQRLSTNCTTLSMYLEAIIPTPGVAECILRTGESAFGWMWTNHEHDEPACDELVSYSSESPLLKTAKLATKLLRLAMCLVQPHFEPSGLALACSSYSELAWKYVEAARQATCHQDVVQSLEGVESLFLEVLYRVHCGDTTAARAALTQTLELAYRLQLDQLPPTTGEELHLVWLRVAYTNQLFALAMGQPSPLRANFRCCANLADPCHRVDQLHNIIVGHILARNNRLCDASAPQAATKNDIWEIERELKDAIRSQPAEYWTYPDTDMCSTTSIEAMRVPQRMMTHIHQFLYILLCHQPLLLQILCQTGTLETFEPGAMASKVSSMFAARQILARLPALISFSAAGSSLKHLIHKLFLASYTVLLIHLDAHSVDDIDPFGHERPFDVNLIKQTIELIGSIDARPGGSPDAVEAVTTLRALMIAEEDALSVSHYTITNEWYCRVRHLDMVPAHVEIIRISMPFFGRLSIYKAGQYHG